MIYMGIILNIVGHSFEHCSYYSQAMLLNYIIKLMFILIIYIISGSVLAGVIERPKTLISICIVNPLLLNVIVLLEYINTITAIGYN